MIIKNFELEKIKSKKINFVLFYGENEGLKNEKIEQIFTSNFKGSIERIDENDVLNNSNAFISSIINKSFFDEKKIILIRRVGEKILSIIENLLERNVDDTLIILDTGNLEKKSKLRTFFEKNNQLVCTPFYKDELKTLSQLALKFFKEKKINVSQEIINLIVEKCGGDRKNLLSELNKISIYLLNKEKINIHEVIKLTNLYEDYSFGELADSCLAKNLKKTIKIINENNITTEDSVIILRTLLMKAKRIYEIKKNQDQTNSVDQIISFFKPPIFWKDKEIVKTQISKWKLDEAENLIAKIHDLELRTKRNHQNSKYIISDFILNIAA